MDYVSVTEISGEKVTQEQVERICHRYQWSLQYCKDKYIAEVACGTGQGLGLIAKCAKSVAAGDYSVEILEIAKKYYKNRINLRQFDAQDLPFDDNSKDVIILFEAIYYLPEAEKFVNECKRVLRKNGKVIIATANKDLYDFNPSPNSYQYYGVVELEKVFTKFGFITEFYGYLDTKEVSWRQKILRPIKRIVVSTGLMPKTMHGKRLLKRLVFGKLVSMPAEITESTCSYRAPEKLRAGAPDERHKVIYCAATLAT